MGFNETFQHVIHVLRERGCTLKSGGVRVATVRFSLNGIEMYKRCTKETGRSVRSIRSDRAGIKEWSGSAYALPQRSSDAQSGSVNAAGGPAAVCLWEALKSHVHPHRSVEGRGSLDYRSLPISHYHSRHSLSAPSCGIATPRPSPPSFSFHQIFTHL